MTANELLARRINEAVEYERPRNGDSGERFVCECVRDGCTEVLVVLSARPGEGSARPTPPGRHDIAWPERLILRAHPQGFRRAYLTRRRRLRRTLALASADPRVLVVAPTSTCLVPSRTCRDRDTLLAAFHGARRRAHELFAPHLPETPGPAAAP